MYIIERMVKLLSGGGYKIKRKSLISLIVMVVLIICSSIILINWKTKFGISLIDSYKLAQGLNGYEKTELSFYEKCEVYHFIINLEYRGSIETLSESIYEPLGTPEFLLVTTYESEIIFLMHNVNYIEAREFRDGELISREKYATTEDQLDKILSMLKHKGYYISARR